MEILANVSDLEVNADNFAILVRNYQRPVYSLCLRMLGSSLDAEDATQETFIRAYKGLERYDRRRSFASWLLAIAAHHCIDRLRRRRVPEVSLDSLPDWRTGSDNGHNPEHAADHALRADRVEAGLMTLTPDYRLVVVLRYWHDLGYAEIADVLGDTEAAVKSRLHRARRLLADVLAKEAAAGTGGDGGLSGVTGPATGPEGGMVWTATLPAT